MGPDIIELNSGNNIDRQEQGVEIVIVRGRKNVRVSVYSLMWVCIVRSARRLFVGIVMCDQERTGHTI